MKASINTTMAMSNASTAIFRIGSPVNPETTNRFNPSGGVMKPALSPLLTGQQWPIFALMIPPVVDKVLI
jgi:hypothetical protein